MGFIDDMLGELSYVEDRIQPHFAQALQGMVGGDDEEGIGLEGLLDRLRAVGLGGIVESWLGQGTSLPITPGQLAEALGQENVGMMAARVDMSPDAFLSALAQHLPALIDRLSPNGQLLPAGATATSTT